MSTFSPLIAAIACQSVFYGGGGAEEHCSVPRCRDWSRSRNQRSTAWAFQRKAHALLSQALQSWLDKVSPSQPGLALVERNKPGYMEEALSSLDMP